MKHYILIISIFLGTLLGSACSIHGAPVQLWFDQANAFYKEQQYDSAALYYENIVQSGTHSSAVYYNLGNSYFRLKKTGLALAAFERALRLSPNDPDIAANIRFVNSSIIDRIALPEQSFYEQILTIVHRLFSLQTQLWILYGGLCIIAALFAWWLFSIGTGRLWLIYGMILTGGITGAIGVSAGIKMYQAENVIEAIVIRSVVDARNQPDGPTIIFSAHEGTKFRIRRTEGNWALCSLPNGVSGWVERDALLSI